MKCPKCGVEEPHSHLMAVDDRHKQAVMMCADFEKFMVKAGYLVACVYMVDMKKLPEDLAKEGAIRAMAIFGSGMDRNTAIDLVQQVGKRSNEIISQSIYIGGDGVIHNDK